MFEKIKTLLASWMNESCFQLTKAHTPGKSSQFSTVRRAQAVLLAAEASTARNNDHSGKANKSYTLNRTRGITFHDKGMTSSYQKCDDFVNHLFFILLNETVLQ